MGGGVNDLMLYPDEGDPVRLRPEQRDPYATEVAYFVDCVSRSEPAIRAMPEDARLALRVALAVKAAAATLVVPAPQQRQQQQHQHHQQQNQRRHWWMCV